jgi:hypothetical protein
LLGVAMVANLALADPPRHEGSADHARQAAPHQAPSHSGGGSIDSRHHDRNYRPRGYQTDRIPPGYRTIYHGPDRYYYHRGVWYRPYGHRFVVFAPPVGLVIPFLPDFYTTVWFGGIPYYYANDVYYVRRDQGDYEVTEPPHDLPESTSPAPPPEDLFIYPRHGQSDEQQAKDRYECHRWAVDQTGFDPSEPGGGVAPELNSAKRSDYRRAMSACLEARDYTVK